MQRQLALTTGHMRRSCRSSFAHITVGLFCNSVPLNAQRADPVKCQNARQAEKDKHDDADAELHKKIVDVNNEYNKAVLACPKISGSNPCLKSTGDNRQQKMVAIQQAQSDEQARDEKAYIDINRNECAARGNSATAPADSEGRILATGDSARLFKLGAEMRVIADDLAQAAQGNAGEEFLKGLADWAKGTIDMLAQKPGVPLQQMAQSIVDYLTNDNAANHAALLKSAEQAVKEFEQNPARFIGQNLPNSLPGPGVLGKIPALRQMANVEKAAARIKAISTAEKVFDKAITEMVDDNRRWGAGTSKGCFGTDVCFTTARTEAEMFRTGGPLGNNTPVGINVYQNGSGQNMSKLRSEITRNLEPVGKSFNPRNAGTFTTEQLAEIAKGNPIRVFSPNEVQQMLQKEGVGSQGLLFAQYHPTPNPKTGQIFNHVMNVEKPGLAPATFIDKTTPGVAPVLDRDRVKGLFFFPMH